MAKYHYPKKKSRFYSTCRKCGKTYHYSNDCCPHCELIPYWLEMAEYYRKKAVEYEAIAKRLQEEQDREAEAERNRIVVGGVWSQ